MSKKSITTYITVPTIVGHIEHTYIQNYLDDQGRMMVEFEDANGLRSVLFAEGVRVNIYRSSI